MTSTTTETDPRVTAARALLQRVEDVHASSITGTELPDLENAVRGLLEYIDGQAFTHQELVVMQDVLGRVQSGVFNTLGIFTMRPEFATALNKVMAAMIATSPGGATPEEVAYFRSRES